MKKETWEMSRFQWDGRGADGASLRPEDVGDLIFSESREQSNKAFSVVSNAVGREGWIYPCALPALKTILAALPNCCAAARLCCLDLVAQIAVSDSAPEGGNVAEECMREIRSAFWYFIYGLQFDDEEFAWVYVDILGCLGARFGELKFTVEEYLKLALSRNLSKKSIDIVKNTLVELAGTMPDCASEG